MSTVTPALYTAEEFLELPDLDGPVELVQGVLRQMPPPFPRHGQICARVARLLGNVADNRFGHVLSNDVCLVTRRNPDTVRGADVAYVSYTKIPKGPLAAGYLSVAVDLVVEVRSPGDRWSDLMKKVLEYLDSGVCVVCVIDPTTETARVYRADRDEEQFCNGDSLKFDDVLPEFCVPLKQLFE